MTCSGDHPNALRFHPERRGLWSCELCAGLVAEKGMVLHARYHGSRGDLDGHRPTAARTSDWSDREVRFFGDLAEVNRV